MGFESFVPPRPVPGCRPNCLVCNPAKGVNMSEADWAELKAQWAEQQRSPFVLYKLVKPDGEGGVRDATAEELTEVEQNSMLACEWQSTVSDRKWVQTAQEVMRKVKACDQAAVVRQWLCVPVALALVPDYTRVIFHLQDLGSVDVALRENGFASPDDWISAVRTVFRNVFVYNRPDGGIGSKIIAAADSASTVFEKELLRLRGITVI